MQRCLYDNGSSLGSPRIRCASHRHAWAVPVAVVLSLYAVPCLAMEESARRWRSDMCEKSTAENAKVRPFVKWVGGKGQLWDQLSRLLPKDLERGTELTYVEPFVGGGAMLFHVLSTHTNITKAVINDLNPDLITTYRIVRDRPKELTEHLCHYQKRYGECASEDSRREFYLSVRDKYNGRGLSDIEVAAAFIFLNRTCFNGLYRVNSKGRFNVPFGKAVNPLVCDAEMIMADSAILQKVEILQGDFESVATQVYGKAFYYFDPPYRPLTLTSSFTAYDKSGFDDTQQKRLAAFCRRLDADGHRWLLSNSDPHNVNSADNFFDELYSGFEINRVSASRMINSKADGRGKITELAIRNYKE